LALAGWRVVVSLVRGAYQAHRLDKIAKHERDKHRGAR
jgi:hypothetical protein